MNGKVHPIKTMKAERGSRGITSRLDRFTLGKERLGGPKDPSGIRTPNIMR
jgi:hypothetical protein